jgi:VanZ family protein
MRNPWIYRAPAIGWGFLIFYACLAPVSDLDPGWEIEISDKLVHFVLYFSWTIFLYFASSRGYKRPIKKRRALVYWLIAVLIGGFIELLQSWMGLGRSADLLDALANTAGAVAGMVLSRVFQRIVA